MNWMLSDIVARLGGELVGEDRAVARVAPLERAQGDEISFVASPKYRKQLAGCQAGALIVPAALAEAAAEGGRPLIVTPDAYLYFARLAQLFHPAPAARAGVHPTATLAEGARVGATSEIGARVVLGRDVVVGERCRILPGVVVGDGTVIGDDVTLYPNVTVYHDCRIGSRVTIHSGAVIGADGFGFAPSRDGWVKIPQVGRVVIGDDVEIGANTTIDRGALDDTVIGQGAIIDNLVQIAHNVEVGARTAIAGCAGIAGSTKIGANVVIGGAVMMVGHISIADGTFIGGGTLVNKSIKTPDNYSSSYPLSTYKEWVSNAVHLRHLDALAKRVKSLERRLAAEQNQEESEQ
ncbi:UDP-3-O-(3-hydroxymyristoyl)glucosamine N-acyltransferase [Crenobacter luteus]|uniref:UDP-3-O-acylglucosamine N-acyltransferase n=1 Tax=Crenobacter luteus TaxID=1452487 RepID=A0A161SKQ7_9NEIS|nr:UDP-3-O-(3-hydroxymyristoyl)glucosamine N-acyltransferase [Crenobacter luteus]KZE34910.1 UDP-3-O-(3-hydroxymyristoyl)glucosamine N-acyltransferase [Crenobacter luteus]